MAKIVQFCSVTFVASLLFIFNTPVTSVCVWQSDEGFRLDCGLKHSGLVRLGSVGGLKGWAGLGFTAGDEVGLTSTAKPKEAAKFKQNARAFGRRFSDTVQEIVVKKSRTTRDGSTDSGKKIKVTVPEFSPLPTADAWLKMGATVELSPQEPKSARDLSQEIVEKPKFEPRRPEVRKAETAEIDEEIQEEPSDREISEEKPIQRSSPARRSRPHRRHGMVSGHSAEPDKLEEKSIQVNNGGRQPPRNVLSKPLQNNGFGITSLLSKFLPNKWTGSGQQQGPPQFKNRPQQKRPPMNRQQQHSHKDREIQQLMSMGWRFTPPEVPTSEKPASVIYNIYPQAMQSMPGITSISPEVIIPPPPQLPEVKVDNHILVPSTAPMGLPTPVQEVVHSHAYLYEKSPEVRPTHYNPGPPYPQSSSGGDHRPYPNYRPGHGHGPRDHPRPLQPKPNSYQYYRPETPVPTVRGSGSSSSYRDVSYRTKPFDDDGSRVKGSSKYPTVRPYEDDERSRVKDSSKYSYPQTTARPKYYDDEEDRSKVKSSIKHYSEKSTVRPTQPSTTPETTKKPKLEKHAVLNALKLMHPEAKKEILAAIINDDQFPEGTIVRIATQAPVGIRSTTFRTPTPTTTFRAPTTTFKTPTTTRTPTTSTTEKPTHRYTQERQPSLPQTQPSYSEKQPNFSERQPQYYYDQNGSPHPRPMMNVIIMAGDKPKRISVGLGSREVQTHEMVGKNVRPTNAPTPPSHQNLAPPAQRIPSVPRQNHHQHHVIVEPTRHTETAVLHLTPSKIGESVFVTPSSSWQTEGGVAQQDEGSMQHGEARNEQRHPNESQNYYNEPIPNFSTPHSAYPTTWYTEEGIANLAQQNEAHPHRENEERSHEHEEAPTPPRHPEIPAVSPTWRSELGIMNPSQHNAEELDPTLSPLAITLNEIGVVKKLMDRTLSTPQLEIVKKLITLSRTEEELGHRERGQILSRAQLEGVKKLMALGVIEGRLGKRNQSKRNHSKGGPKKTAPTPQAPVVQEYDHRETHMTSSSEQVPNYGFQDFAPSWIQHDYTFHTKQQQQQPQQQHQQPDRIQKRISRSSGEGSAAMVDLSDFL